MRAALSAFLNDRSLSPAQDMNEARRRMTVFIKTYRKLTTRVPLRCVNNLSDLILADGYPLAQWRNDNAVDIEERRYLKAISNHFPSLAGLPEHDDAALGQEAFLEETSSLCCLSAYLASGLVLSFDSEPPRWQKDSIEVVVHALDEDGAVQQVSCKLPHGCWPEHLDRWRDWMDLRLRSVESPDELWFRRQTLYPNLVFFPRVEKDLRDLSATQFEQVRAKLDDLQREACNWTDGTFPHHHLHHSTPESKPTLKHYSAERTFTGPNDDVWVFTWHQRFSPDAGRLYYHPAHLGNVWIGYIGPHLSTVKYPT